MTAYIVVSVILFFISFFVGMIIAGAGVSEDSRGLLLTGLVVMIVFLTMAILGIVLT